MAGVPHVEHKETKAEKEYQDFLYQTLGPATLILGVIVCIAIGQTFDLQDENSLPCLVAMTPEEVDGIVPPASRLLAKANLPTKVRSAIVSSGDTSALVIVALGYFARLFSIAQQQQQQRGYPNNVSSISTVRPTSGTPQQQPTATTNSDAALQGAGAVNFAALAQFGGYATS